MSGPQGSDPTQPWPGQQPEQGKDQPSSDPSANQPWQPPTSGADQPTTAAPTWQPPAYDSQQQQPAYDPQQHQYPQYQQPSQYGQYPQYGATAPEEGSKRSLAVIGGVIGLLAAIVVAVVLVLGFWKPGFFVTTKLDISAAQTGVQQILTDEANGYGAKNVKDVKCNGGTSPTV